MNGSPQGRVFLLPARDKRIAGGHPWAYANEIRLDAETKALTPGTVVSLHRVDGKPLGVGTFNPHALMAFRLFDRDARTRIDAAFLRERLEAAKQLRETFFDAPYYRLCHAEADGLPGLVVDRFGDLAVVQTATAGMEALLPDVLAALDAVIAPETVVLRNDARGRSLEGLGSSVSVAKGRPSRPSEVLEGNLRFAFDPLEGQKTGWFFDQRENRIAVAPLGRGGKVLDACCHTGAFAIHAVAAGAESVLGVDSSEPALELAAENASRNGVAERCAFRRGDVFDVLGDLAAGSERFQLVIADPPAFVKSKRELATGLRGYRKLADRAARLVAPGGWLFIASCSHNVDAAAFAAEVAKGIAKAGRTGRIVRASGAAADHPVHPHLPETAYLKGLTLRLD